MRSIEVVFSYPRSKEKLNRLAREARGNAQAGTAGVRAGGECHIIGLRYADLPDKVDGGAAAGRARRNNMIC
jgi:hypothetical protein